MTGVLYLHNILMNAEVIRSVRKYLIQRCGKPRLVSPIQQITSSNQINWYESVGALRLK